MAFAANGGTTASRFDVATGQMTEWFSIPAVACCDRCPGGGALVFHPILDEAETDDACDVRLLWRASVKRPPTVR